MHALIHAWPSVLLATAGSLACLLIGSVPAAAQPRSLDMDWGEVVYLRISEAAEPALGADGAANDSSPRPALLVGLHGHGIDERQMASLVPLRPAMPHVYVAVRGLLALEDGSRSWLDFAFDGRELVMAEEELARCLDRLAQVVDRLIELEGADPRHVYSIGYSLGASVSLALALRHPDRVRAAAAMAGLLLPHSLALAAPAEHLHGLPVFLAHGTRDRLLPAARARADAVRLRQLGVELRYGEYAVPHVVSAAQRRDLERWLAQVWRDG